MKSTLIISCLVGMLAIPAANAKQRRVRVQKSAQTQMTNEWGNDSGYPTFGQWGQPEPQRPLKRRELRAQQLEQQRQQQQWSGGSFGGGGFSSGGVRPGETCSRADRDPVKCKVCAIYGEDHGSRQGMHAVAGVIETRVKSGNWGSHACDVVHARGQFVGAWRRLPNNPALIAEMEAAAQGASANGYMGFRSYCKRGRSTRIGGNCYGVASAEKFIVLDPTMTAEDVDAQAFENVQYAEAIGDTDAG